MASTLDVEVVVHAPSVFLHCRQCEVALDEAGLGRGIRADQLGGALPEDLARDHSAVREWVHRLRDSYGDRVAVRIVDATSPAGVWLALRHRLRRYPAVVIRGGEKWIGTDLAAAEAVIARRVGS